MPKHGPRDYPSVLATRYTLTPAGCAATGGHNTGRDGTCRLCGTPTSTARTTS